MTTVTITPPPRPPRYRARVTGGGDEHVRAALKFLEHSDREFADGDQQQGSEKLWGAASQAVFAIAKRRGWRYGESNARGAAVVRLAEEQDDPLLAADYIAAELFHANFYHDFMEDDAIERARPGVHRFVRRIMELMEASE